MILVTGAAGFVGRHVVRELTSRGHEVRALVRTQSRAALISGPSVEIATGDVLDPGSLTAAFEGVDAVIHLVAIIRERGSLTFSRVNHEGTRNVANAAASAQVKRFVHASTIGASADQTTSYLHSRWLAEQEISQAGFSSTIVRLSLGFGEGDEFTNVLAAQVKLAPVVPIIGDGATRLQPIVVQDIARCLVLSYEQDGVAGKTVEVGGPEHFTYEEMVDLVIETMGARRLKVHLPPRLMGPVVAVMEALMPRSPVTVDQLKMLNLDNTTTLDSVEASYGFVPVSPRGNLDHVLKIGLLDALKINLGTMPSHIRDH